MNEEAKLIISSAKLTGLNLETLLSDTINWSMFFKQSITNRTLSLSMHNIRKYCNYSVIPKHLRNMERFASIGNKQQNTIYLEECNNFISLCKRNSVNSVPVKGAALIPLLYKDLGLRSMGDVDCLIKKEDISIIDKIMTEMGYIKGKYNSVERKIVPISRSEDLKWKLNMSNLPPYLKLCDSEYLPVIKFDFRFSLDDNLSLEAMEEIIEYFNKYGEVKSSHILIHLCTHLYDESKQSMNVMIGKDINLIKYVDIREFILQIMSESDLFESVEFCYKYKLVKQLYYALHHLKLIYNDGYEDKYMQMLGITDTIFLNTYGEKTTIDNNVWKKPFFERMFSGDNRDELNVIPKFFAE